MCAVRDVGRERILRERTFCKRDLSFPTLTQDSDDEGILFLA